MKKLLTLCLALALLFSVSALAEEAVVLTPADVIGAWSVTAYGLEGEIYSVADLGLTSIYLVLEEGGFGSITDEEDGITGAIDWEISGSSLIINGGAMVLTMKDGQLAYTDEESNVVMYFSAGAEQAAEDPWPDDLPWADPAGDAELDISGTWNLAYIKMSGKYIPASALDTGSMTLEVSADGTMTIDNNGKTAGASWTREGAVIFIHAADGEGQFLIENGNITFDTENIRMILTR